MAAASFVAMWVPVVQQLDGDVESTGPLHLLSPAHRFHAIVEGLANGSISRLPDDVRFRRALGVFTPSDSPRRGPADLLDLSRRGFPDLEPENSEGGSILPSVYITPTHEPSFVDEMKSKYAGWQRCYPLPILKIGWGSIRERKFKKEAARN